MRRLLLIAYVCAPLMWLACFERVGRFTWGHGRETIAFLVAPVLLLVALVFSRLPRAPRWLCIMLSVLCVLFTIVQARNIVTVAIDDLQVAEGGHAIDIGANTYLAGTHVLEGRNPYTHFAQSGQHPRPEAHNHIRVHHGEVFMYGVPYRFGYPYFPMMAVSYLPFRAFAEGYHSLRVGNLVFLFLNLVALLWWSLRVCDRQTRFAAAGVALALYVGLSVLPTELMTYAITDLVIATYALYAFVALSYRHHVVAGILVGLAQASKLLPGPFLFVPIVVWLSDSRTRTRFALAFAVTTSVCVLPFVALNPKLFVSSTLLFYLTHHAAGDDTSLWFFLSDELKPLWSLAGYALSIAPLAYAGAYRNALHWPMLLSFVSYIVFIAFAKMTHLNYIWSVYTLGVAAFTVYLFGHDSQRDKSEDHAEQEPHQLR